MGAVLSPGMQIIKNFNTQQKFCDYNVKKPARIGANIQKQFPKFLERLSILSTPETKTKTLPYVFLMRFIINRHPSRASGYTRRLVYSLKHNFTVEDLYINQERVF